MGQPLPNQHHNIWTPELVEISLPLAGISRRILARLIDQVILVVFWGLLFLGGILALSYFPELISSEENGWYVACGFLIVIALTEFLYFTCFHMFTGGKTPGKYALGIRLVTARGGRINLTTALIRSVFNILDMALFSGGVSALMILGTEDEKRIADFAAGTIVILDR